MRQSCLPFSKMGRNFAQSALAQIDGDAIMQYNVNRQFVDDVQRIFSKKTRRSLLRRRRRRRLLWRIDCSNTRDDKSRAVERKSVFIVGFPTRRTMSGNRRYKNIDDWQTDSERRGITATRDRPIAQRYVTVFCVYFVTFGAIACNIYIL